MILEDSEITARIESPLNLLNRLRRDLNRRTPNTNVIPFLPPTTDQIIEDIEDKLKSSNGALKTKAASIMSDALDVLKERLIGVDRPEKLSQIASDMNKIIGVKDNNDNVNKAQVIIYAPQHRTENHYEMITVNE